MVTLFAVSFVTALAGLGLLHLAVMAYGVIAERREAELVPVPVPIPVRDARDRK